MGEVEALTQLDAVMERLTRVAARAVSAEEPVWDQVIVSIKWADTESGICDVILASIHGDKERYHSAPMEAFQSVMELSAVQRGLARPWDELLLRIGPDGACKVEFGYPESAQDAARGTISDGGTPAE